MGVLGLLLFVDAERSPRESQAMPNRRYKGMRVAEHAPRSPFCVLERIHGLAEIVERGCWVLA